MMLTNLGLWNLFSPSSNVSKGDLCILISNLDRERERERERERGGWGIGIKITHTNQTLPTVPAI